MKLKTIICRAVGCGLAGTMLAALMTPLQAETIIIGTEHGVVYNNLPFSGHAVNIVDDVRIRPSDIAVGVVGPRTGGGGGIGCDNLQKIAGYMAIPLYSQSCPNCNVKLGLVPVATASVSYEISSGEKVQINAHIGPPKTEGVSSREGVLTPLPGSEYCLPAKTTSEENYFKMKSRVEITASGYFLVVSEGYPSAGDYITKNINLFSNIGSHDWAKGPLLQGLTVRVRSIQCTVNTPTTIDFGAIPRNIQAGTELASRVVPLNTACTQGQFGQLDSNINMELKALTGLYEGVPSRLALKQGGGYITGEIDKTSTGSGACSSTSGVRFDQTPITVGKMSSNETSKVFDKQLTWRLCSGGSSLPAGAVDAAAELLVTFN